MQRQNFGKKIRKIRNNKGISQELLAEESGLSIRTIQRIEKGETSPNGDTIRKISASLKVDLDDLIDGALHEDTDFLKKINLSALSFIFFPLLGILVPALIWSFKKDKIKDVNIVAKKLINFEITWTILFFLFPIYIKPFLYVFMEPFMNIFNISLGYDHWTDAIIIWTIMYLINIIFIVLNTFRLHDGKELKYFPSIRFLKF